MWVYAKQSIKETCSLKSVGNDLDGKLHSMGGRYASSKTTT